MKKLPVECTCDECEAIREIENQSIIIDSYDHNGEHVQTVIPPFMQHEDE